MKIRFTVLALAAVGFWAGNVAADPITWPDNGNTYDIILGDTPITWDEARAAAEAMGGHLVTITSSEENEFVAWLVNSAGLGNPEIVWLGGYQVPGSGEPLGTWAWVTGEAWWDDDGAAWAPGEPNNGVGGSQHYLHYWPDAGQFDDMENRNIMIGYVIEYESVSEPGTLALLGIGLLCLGLGRRKLRLN